MDDLLIVCILAVYAVIVITVCSFILYYLFLFIADLIECTVIPLLDKLRSKYKRRRS